MEKERYEKLLSITNRSAFFSASVQNLKLKFQSDCVFAYDGHFFTASMELLGYLNLNEERQKAVVIDDHGFPVLVNLGPYKEFPKIAETTYNEATLSYFTEYENLIKKTEGIFNEDG